MKNFYSSLVALCLCISTINAQDLPLKIEVPALSSDPNLQFNMLNFDVMGKDKFSILYYTIVPGSVIHAGEFVSDTGEIVFTDRRQKEVIDHSNSGILLKRQIIDGGGNLLHSDEWLIAARELGSEGEYKLYFRRGFKHPLVANRTVITHNLNNLDWFKGISEAEKASLVDLSVIVMGQVSNGMENTPSRPGNIVEDIMATRQKFKDLKATGLSFRGDLPATEAVLTRYNIVSDRIFVITRVKEKDKTKPTILKFYVTTDYKTFDCLDSARVTGEVTLTSAATIYNTNAEAIGAFTNLHVKNKDEKGEDLNQQFSVAMDADYKVSTWLHSVGKNKLNSLSPEVCWYEGSNLWVLSNNREKLFKTYVQMHLLERGKPATLLFPATEEEKGSEKTKFVKTFQPLPPSGIGTAPAIPERYIPIYFTTAGETRYIIMQGTRMEPTVSKREYLSVNIYRIEGKGKVTNVDMLSDYKAFYPMPLPRIVKNPEAEFFLLEYPFKIQLAFYADRSEISPLDTETSALITKSNDQFLTVSPYGSAVLRRSKTGMKHTLLFYPKL